MTVAIPVLNGRPLLDETLAAVRAQRIDRPVELLVADSGSTDGSADLARERGAEVIEVPPGEFSHGGTRNLLAERARGTHVAFLTQDSVPAHERWLERLLEGFELADDVALAFGPYRPRADASHMVRRELRDWFASFAPDGAPRVDRGPVGHDAPLGRREFFTDANGCVARAAWRRVPFRDVAYAEDHALARDMLGAGYAKAYVPAAEVVHSHDYGALELFRRSFDEWRALREVHGARAPAGPVRTALVVQREVRDDMALLRADGRGGAAVAGGALRSLGHHVMRTLGAALGSRPERLPPRVRRLCSLEGRA